ncbi:MAG: hypothetical protein IJR88_04430 [Clostridia bacterium]|nr:hypothetical protein [Clostridia bacterium]
METTLVVMAAGLGSRFGGNKQISHVGPHGEILMEYAIYDALAEGFTQVVFILKKEMVDEVKTTIGDRIAKRVKVAYAVQDYDSLPAWYKVPVDRVKPFGTVHAVLAAKDLIEGPFATINADDYYGREAFAIMYKMLNSFKDKSDAGMVPYILGNTMSENGSVTRGVCKVQGGKLQSICETSDIHFGEGRKVFAGENELSDKEQVSMNIWGFHPDLLQVMNTYFEDFLRALNPEDIKKECLLPVMVGDFLANKTITVKAEPSHDKWFGLTYKEDRDIVIEELKALHKNGTYPEMLF